MAKRIPTWIWVLGAIVLVVLFFVQWVISSYNSLVELDGEVQNSWAQVEVQYQRRADLVPQLVATVEGAADFEKGTLLDVTEARTNWLDTQADPNATIEDQIAASNQFDSAFSRLLVTVEAYPTLTATEGFSTLQSQLEGTENRISVARMDYNEVATTYNISIRRFPMLLFAGFFNFDNYPLFESDEGSAEAPTIEFDL